MHRPSKHHGRTHLLSGLMLCSLILPLVIAACGPDPADDHGREVARNVRVMPLEAAAVTEFIELAGPLLPVRGTDIGSEESGTVAAIDHDKGARVAAGAPVIRLDRRLLAADLQAARAAHELQEYSHAQTEQLHEAGKVSRLELLQSAAQLAQARSQHDVARTRHERAAIKAPFDGLVVARHVERGQLVMPGTAVARVVDPYILKLSGTATEREVAWISAGMPALLAVAGSPEPVTGVVTWVGFEADRQTGKFPLEIHVDNSDLALRSGVIARARITKRTTDDLVVIPRDAILPGQRTNHVFVVADDRARKREVELGPDQGLLVAVRSGLAVGDLLVVRGQRALRDGSLVNVAERVSFGDGATDDEPAVIRATSADTRIGGEVGR